MIETVTKHALPEKHVENICNARSPGSNRGERKFRFATNSEFKVANQHISGKKPLRKLTSNPLPPDINQPGKKLFLFHFCPQGSALLCTRGRKDYESLRLGPRKQGRAKNLCPSRAKNYLYCITMAFMFLFLVHIVAIKIPLQSTGI